MAKNYKARFSVHPAYGKVLRKRCAEHNPDLEAKRRRAGCAPRIVGVQLLPGAAYYVDDYRMLKVPADYDGPTVFIEPETMKRAKGDTVEALRERRRNVQAVEDRFVREASVVVQAGALRDAFKALKRCKIVGMLARDDAVILFAVDSSKRCLDARKVPAKVDGNPPPVYLQRRFLKDTLDLPGDEVRIDVQERDEDDLWLPTDECIRISIGNAVEYIATWGVREVRHRVSLAWQAGRRAAKEA